MTRSSAARIAAMFGVLGALGASACAEDPKVEDETPPGQGIEQPSPSGSEALTLAEACDQVVEAENAARDRLDCDGEPAECPGHLRVAGALPCDSVNRATVEACVETIGEYESCADFSRSPCVVTVDAESCRAPDLPEAGPDAEPGADGGGTDASMDASGDGPSDDAPAGEGGVTDAAPDGFVEASASDAPSD